MAQFFKNKFFIGGVLLLLLVATVIIILLIVRKYKSGPGSGPRLGSGPGSGSGSGYLPTPTDDISQWLSNLYTTLDWNGKPTSSLPGASPVSGDWINWAKTSPNAMMQYFVNYRRTTQKVLSSWPTTDADIIINPVYSWEGLINAVYIWNKCVALNSASSNKPLGDVPGFCNESDILKRQMTLACFLGNATVESAYFLVCKESTDLTNGALCPGDVVGGIIDPSIKANTKFNSRYFQNCDFADPMGYSCQGGSGSSGGATCNPTTTDPTNVCQTPGCYDATKQTCNLSGDGVTWVSWDSSIIPNEAACTAEQGYKYNIWCPERAPPPPPSGPAPPPFNPLTSNCNIWPQCQFPGSDGKFINAPGGDIHSDPCMTDPYADGSNTPHLDNDKPTCTDWNGNLWAQQQECYFGRGLIQLTYSCNYYQAQRFLRLMGELISSNETDETLSKFKNALTLPFTDPASINLCANPDTLCGNYTLDANNDKAIYSPNALQQIIPWLACIIYWATKCAPQFNKCYSFLKAYEGIAPSGAGAPADRLNAMKLLLEAMGNDLTDTTKFSVSAVDIVLAPCTAGSGSGGGGSGGGYTGRCIPNDGTTPICKNGTSVIQYDWCSVAADCKNKTDKCEIICG